MEAQSSDTKEIYRYIKAVGRKYGYVKAFIPYSNSTYSLFFVSLQGVM
jgi:hypothetical protein